jgi:peptidoglycan/xylan/chitin deacetylase (PgdA/CDA1 family)
VVEDTAAEPIVTETTTHWDDEEPEPNPVMQIIVTRTLQTVAITVPLLIGLRVVLSPDRFGLLLRAGGPLVTAALSAYFAAAFHARSPLFSLLSGRGNGFISRLPASAGNTVALTFDDGPHPRSTPYLLDILAQHNARATFFLVGERVSRCPEVVRRMADEGHAIGVHGLRHRTMVLQKPAQVRNDIQEAIRSIEEAAGAPLPFPRLLRPPYGFKTPLLGRMAARLGCRIIAWSLDPRDYDPISSDSLMARLAQKVSPGSIVLLHERPGESVTAQALPSLLKLCHDRGLECRPLSPFLIDPNRR